MPVTGVPNACVSYLLEHNESEVPDDEHDEDSDDAADAYGNVRVADSADRDPHESRRGRLL